MTMAHLISKRVAEDTRNLSRPLSSRLSPNVSSGVEAATALEEWEAEGGASASVQQPSEHGASPSPLERLLLQRLGAALVRVEQSSRTAAACGL